MKFYDMTNSLHVETDTSSNGLGAGLLQVRDGMNFMCDEIPDNVILHPLHILTKTYLVQNSTTATQNVRLMKFYMG